LVLKRTEEGNDYTYTYSGRESLIRSDIVFVAKQGENDLFIDSGEHKYPFTISLPAHLPTSFEHAYGTIRYLVKATIDMPRYYLRNFKVIHEYITNCFVLVLF
jgi:hypothetical protein